MVMLGMLVIEATDLCLHGSHEHWSRTISIYDAADHPEVSLAYLNCMYDLYVTTMINV